MKKTEFWFISRTTFLVLRYKQILIENKKSNKVSLNFYTFFDISNQTFSWKFNVLKLYNYAKPKKLTLLMILIHINLIVLKKQKKTLKILFKTYLKDICLQNYGTFLYYRTFWWDISKECSSWTFLNSGKNVNRNDLTLKRIFAPNRKKINAKRVQKKSRDIIVELLWSISDYPKLSDFISLSNSQHLCD